MRYFSSLCLVLMLGLSLAGCSGSGDAIKNDTRDNIGSHPRVVITAIGNETFVVRYAYRFLRVVDEPGDIMLETEWRDLQPTDDERALGVTAVRNKFLVQARPRNRTTSLANSYTVIVRTETEARTVDNDYWTPIAITPERKEYIDEIVDFYETEMRIQG
ncbi:MAG: hypothetical protein AAGJ10_04855 [Bacteroidota bacterium]